MYRSILILLTLFVASGYVAVAAQPVDVADLEISGTDSPDPVNAGSNITYSITATNHGPDAAKNVAVTIALGSGLTFVSGTGCIEAAGTVTCDLGNMSVGAQAFDVTVNAGATGSVSSSLAIASSHPHASDPIPGNNSSSISTTVDGNGAPVADDQNVTTDEDTDLAITLTASDPENDPLSFSVVNGPSNGSLSGTEPNLTYTPDPNFSGSDSFTFEANDGQADSNIATISITVDPVNDAPVAVIDSYNVDEDGNINVPASGVLGNDSDIDGDGLSAHAA